MVVRQLLSLSVLESAEKAVDPLQCPLDFHHSPLSSLVTVLFLSSVFRQCVCHSGHPFLFCSLVVLLIPFYSAWSHSSSPWGHTGIFSLDAVPQEHSLHQPPISSPLSCPTPPITYRGFLTTCLQCCGKCIVDDSGKTTSIFLCRVKL